MVGRVGKAGSGRCLLAFLLVIVNHLPSSSWAWVDVMGRGVGVVGLTVLELAVGDIPVDVTAEGGPLGRVLGVLGLEGSA